MVHACNPNYEGGIGMKISDWGQCREKEQNPIQKITKAQGAEDMAQVGEHLHSKHKTLSSNSSTEKKHFIVAKYT
jgi:hypothetical protein